MLDSLIHKKTFLHSKKNQGTEQGFALQELMITLVIIGVLAAIAIPIFLTQQRAVQQSTLDTELVNAEIIIQAEREQNNGVYPAYRPTALKTSTSTVTLTYTYSNTQLEYCIRGTSSGLTTKYVGSASKGKLTTTNCTQPNVGGAQPGNDNSNTNPAANNHQPIINSLAPATIKSRAGGETVTINGAYFLNGASVLFDGVEIAATVVNANRIEFVNLGATTYRDIEIQVKNPNGRTSDPAKLSLVNPIIGTTADQPEPPLFQSNADGSALTITSPAVSCPFNATPQYSFSMTTKDLVENTYIPTVSSSDNQQIADWRNDRAVTIASENGQRYGFKTQARCTLEGENGNSSALSEETRGITNLITGRPSLTFLTLNPAGTVSPNTPITASRFNAAICGTATAMANVYVNNVRVYNGSEYTFERNARSTAGTEQYTTEMYCSTRWIDSDPIPGGSASITIAATPSKPAAPTNLRITTNGGTSATVAWNAVTCSVGTPNYRFQWVTLNGSPNSAMGGYQTGLTFTTSSVNQGTSNTWRVEATCASQELRGAATNSSNSTFTSIVIGPAGSWGSVGNNGRYAVSAPNESLSCTANATKQFRVIVGSQSSTTNPATGSSWAAGNSKSIVNGTLGATYSANLQARCVVGSAVSGAINSPTTTWVAR